MFIAIFSSRKAASWKFPVNGDPEGNPLPADSFFSQPHAQYSFDAAGNEQALVMEPVGAVPLMGHTPYATRIELPPPVPLHCRLEINNRCLISMQDFIYPAASGKRQPGRVTMAARIARGGQVSHVRVIKAESSPESYAGTLSRAATENLASWRLESAAHQQAFQITFSYVVDNALHHVDGTKVDWALPSEVTIKGPPD